jgi:DivIVA domain-containing protein
MDENFNLTRDQILSKKFTPNVKGYDPDEVDDFLDLIIADYAAFERYMKESKGYIEELELGTNKLKAQNHQLEKPAYLELKTPIRSLPATSIYCSGSTR